MEDVVKITKTGTTVVSESILGSFGIVYISQLAVFDKNNDYVIEKNGHVILVKNGVNITINAAKFTGEKFVAGINETSFNFYEGSVRVDDGLTGAHYDFKELEFDAGDRVITAHNVKMAL